MAKVNFKQSSVSVVSVTWYFRFFFISWFGEHATFLVINEYKMQIMLLFKVLSFVRKKDYGIHSVVLSVLQIFIYIQNILMLFVLWLL